MPNPYNGNEEAAWFVDYYASPRMTSETVHRLYTCGIQHHQLVQRRAEEKAYPPVPTALRTRAEMERYLRERVQGELLRRQQHRAALRRQYNQQQQQQQQRHYTATASGGDGGAAVADGDKATPRRCLTEKELQRHLRKLYVEPMRRRAQRQQQQRQHADSDGVDEQQQRQRRRLLHELEMGWRPPSAHIAHKDDGTRLLVWQDTSPSRTATAATTTPGAAAAMARTPASRCASVPARSSSSPAAAIHKQQDTNKRSNTPSPPTQQQQKKQTAHRGNRLAELAKPLRVTPRIIAAPHDADAPPSFRVSLK